MALGRSWLRTQRVGDHFGHHAGQGIQNVLVGCLPERSRNALRFAHISRSRLPVKKNVRCCAGCRVKTRKGSLERAFLYESSENPNSP